jgi:hypothetical protein
VGRFPGAGVGDADIQSLLAISRPAGLAPREPQTAQLLEMFQMCSRGGLDKIKAMWTTMRKLPPDLILAQADFQLALDAGQAELAFKRYAGLQAEWDKQAADPAVKEGELIRYLGDVCS